MADDVPLQLYPSLGLFLVPQTNIIIDVLIPETRTIGASISNWEMMEKLKLSAQPEEFVSLRVDHCSREKITFKGELRSLRALGKVILMLNGKKMKMHGFTDSLRVKAYSSDVHYPKKTDWEGYYRSKGLVVFSDGHPGERPDTVKIKGIPLKWFVLEDDPDSGGHPSEVLLSQTFSRYGHVENVGVYVPDTNPLQDTGSFASFGPSARECERTFEAYVQFSDYEGFCSAMLGLKGMKLMKKNGNEDVFEVEVEVDYDRSGYMTVECVRKRLLEDARQRELRRQARLQQEEKERQEMERLQELRKKQKEERELQRIAKRKQEKMIIKRLKELTDRRKVEAQRLLRVLLAGAAEEVYQEERRKGIPLHTTTTTTSSSRSSRSRSGIGELKKQVRELESRKKAIQCELKHRKQRLKTRLE